MHALPRWWTESKRLRALGDVAGSNRVLMAAGKRGNLEAAATLARHLWLEPETGSSIAILEEVARRVKPNDWKTHFAVHLAYSMGIGADVEEYLEIQRRAFAHLKAAAKASSDPRMYFSVGLHYWQGLNSVPKDIECARTWLEAAAASGDTDFGRAYRKFTRDHPPRNSKSAA